MLGIFLILSCKSEKPIKTTDNVNNKAENPLLCPHKEVSSEIPEYLKDSEIGFEKEMYYVTGLKPEIVGCIDAIRNTNRVLVSSENMEMVGGYPPKYFKEGIQNITKVRADMKFDVVKSFIDHPSGINIDANDVEYFLLKDENGVLSITPHLEFMLADVNGGRHAGYYKDGKRIGDVKTTT